MHCMCGTTPWKPRVVPSLHPPPQVPNRNCMTLTPTWLYFETELVSVLMMQSCHCVSDALVYPGELLGEPVFIFHHFVLFLVSLIQPHCPGCVYLVAAYTIAEFGSAAIAVDGEAKHHPPRPCPDPPPSFVSGVRQAIRLVASAGWSLSGGVESSTSSSCTNYGKSRRAL